MKFVLIFLLSLVDACLGRLCYYRSSYDDGYSYYYDTSIYCSGGCCGYYYYRYCCSYLAGGAIAGIVLGCLFAIALVVSCIVCLCCIAKKRQASAGVVYQQNPGVQAAYVVSSTNQGQQFVGFGQQYPVVVNEPGNTNAAYSQGT